MLLDEDTFPQTLDRVATEYRHLRLADDRTRIELFRYQMYGAPVRDVAGRQCPGMSVQTGVLGEQARVDV